jgi:hypothetical protein
MISMSTLKKRRASEDRERAEATLPIQRWWIGVLTWVVVALAVGAISMLIAPPKIEATPDKMTLARYLGVAVFNVIVMFAAPYYAARQVLARRSLKEIWNLESNKNALNRIGLPTLLTVIGFLVITARGTVSESLFTGLMAFSTIFAIYRALTTAYTTHYFDYVVSPREVREIANDREIKGKKRLFLERVAVTAGIRFPRERLVMPLVQTVLVAFGLRFLISLAWTAFGGNPQDADQAAIVQIISPALTVASAVLWAVWHLNGGSGKILRISKGRSMKSFGWANPGFTKNKKMV